MTTKHTPGPWRTMDRPENAIWIQGQPDENGYREICTLPNYQLLKREQTEANARLIAAAPELLEALRACDLFLTAHGQGWINASNEGRNAWKMARAAIAKAQGKA